MTTTRGPPTTISVRRAISWPWRNRGYRPTRLAEAPLHHEPITSYEPYSTGAANYRELAYELLKRGA
jgi:cellulose biosynthesis protein BcsQ